MIHYVAHTFRCAISSFLDFECGGVAVGVGIISSSGNGCQISWHGGVLDPSLKVRRRFTLISADLGPLSGSAMRATYSGVFGIICRVKSHDVTWSMTF